MRQPRSANRGERDVEWPEQIPVTRKSGQSASGAHGSLGPYGPEAQDEYEAYVSEVYVDGRTGDRGSACRLSPRYRGQSHGIFAQRRTGGEECTRGGFDRGASAEFRDALIGRPRIQSDEVLRMISARWWDPPRMTGPSLSGRRAHAALAGRTRLPASRTAAAVLRRLRAGLIGLGRDVAHYRDLLAHQLFDLAQRGPFGRIAERDRDALGPGARGAADAVDIAL